MFLKTRIDIADFHTTLTGLNDPPHNQITLPIHDKNTYNALYRNIDNDQGGVDYHQVSNGNPGSAFKRLMPWFSDDKFWRRYLQTERYSQFARLAWDFQVPIKVRLSFRISITDCPDLSCRVRPQIFAVLFPFGWSSWLSLLVTGPHDIQGLANLMEHVFNENSFTIEDTETTMRLKQLFGHISEGVVTDAFFGQDTKERSEFNLYSTVTVLEKQRGTLASGGLSEESEQALIRIIHPTEVLPSEDFQNFVHTLQLAPGDEPDYNFMLIDDFGRFTWLYRLLSGNPRDHIHLECYHYNLFHIFLITYHQVMLLKSALPIHENLDPGLVTLIKHTIVNLRNPEYLNMSLEHLHERNDVKQIIDEACDRWFP